jgi:energy-coupling factor transport system permease protein
MTYRRRASPLHAARAVVGAAWCLALTGAALTVQHPLVLGVLLGAVLTAAAGARVGRGVARALRWAVPFGLVILVVNALVTRDGLTVALRLGPLPGYGEIDVTLEALATGAVLGLTAIVLVTVAALYSLAVDPDDLLRALRRVSFRSALTAALATRMVPVLARDARRLADAQRCRAGAAASRTAIVRAVAAGALDRAVDVAATLEVRGYGSARRAPAVRRPWSRHDLAFAASAAGIVALAVLVRVAGLAPLSEYPRFAAPVHTGTLLAAAAFALVALLPFADRRGVGR